MAVNAAAYLWAGFSELGIKTPDRGRPPAPGGHPFTAFLAEMVEGAPYVWQHRGLRTLLAVYTVLNFFVTPLLALIAFFVQDFLGLGPEWTGYLYACYAGGGLVGFAVAGAVPVRGRSREALVGTATIAQSATVVLMLLLPGTACQIVLFALAGVLGGLVNVHVMTLIQTAAPLRRPDPRGGSRRSEPPAGRLKMPLRRRSWFRPRLDWLQVEVTTVCPAACACCPRTVYRRLWRPRHMGLETLRLLRPVLATCRMVYLQGWGEPLTHPGLFEMLRMAKEAGCQAGMTTSGMGMARRPAPAWCGRVWT